LLNLPFFGDLKKWEVERKYTALEMCLTCIDEFIAHKDIIKKEKDGLSKNFNCNDLSELDDYVGCKIEIDRSEKKRR
jgi:hypothetical protein